MSTQEDYSFEERTVNIAEEHQAFCVMMVFQSMKRIFTLNCLVHTNGISYKKMISLIVWL